MYYLNAKTDKQLGMCLRMLYAEGITEMIVKPLLNEKHKVEFHVVLDVEESEFNTLKNRYETLTL